MRPRTVFIAGAAVLALAACRGAAPSPPASLTPSPARASSLAPTPTPPPGPQRFLADVRAAGAGNRDVASASDHVLLNIGRAICDGLDGALGYQDVVSVIQHHDKITTQQATIWVDSAVRNLCPAHLNEVPSGAP